MAVLTIANEEDIIDKLRFYREATKHLSSSEQALATVAGQELVAFGPAVIPVMLRHFDELGTHLILLGVTVAPTTPVLNAPPGDVSALERTFRAWAAKAGYGGEE